MMNPDDPYLVLGVARDCDAEAIKVAYRRLARDNHPDIAGDKEAATRRMTQINAAWAMLGDPNRRAGFDARVRLEERERAARARLERERASAPPAPKRASSTQPRRTEPPPSARASSPKHSPRPAPAKRAPVMPSRHAKLAEASRLLFKHNKPNEALDVCRAILRTDFRNIPARELMGEAYLRLGQTERALAVWEQALVLSPGNLTLRRRWLQLMSPEVRATQERRVPPVPTVVRTTPLNSTQPKGGAKPKVGLLERLVGKLRGK